MLSYSLGWIWWTRADLPCTITKFGTGSSAAKTAFETLLVVDRTRLELVTSSMQVRRSAIELTALTANCLPRTKPRASVRGATGPLQFMS